MEGQPGSGKSTFTDIIYENFKRRNINIIVNDEYKQDTEIFTDFWEDLNTNGKEVTELFLSKWKKYIEDNKDSKQIHLFDNSLMNHVQYLMAINTPTEDIEAFFKKIVELFNQIEVKMIFFDGDSNIVIQKVDQVRQNGWGERVALLLESTPYQATRGRFGKLGMAEFFYDSQVLKNHLLSYWKQSLLKIDMTHFDWLAYEKQILDFIKVLK